MRTDRHILPRPCSSTTRGGINAFDLSDELIVSYSLLKREVLDFNGLCSGLGVSIVSRGNMLSVVAMIVEGKYAISGMRKLMGKTKYQDAEPGTIRGDFAESTTRNIIHGSDSEENAKIEIRRFFGEDA